MGVTVTLTKPFMAFGREIRELTLDEPTGKLYTKLGEPMIVCENRSGSVYLVEQADIIRAYLDELIGPTEIAAIALKEMSLTDAKALKKALIGFFSAAEQKISESSSPASSSGSA